MCFLGFSQEFLSLAIVSVLAGLFGQIVTIACCPLVKSFLTFQTLVAQGF
ncbi:hypothetical protein MICCA_3110007 [Microcystis aeruginosa PCC 9432]|nr:hypothetical protein BH695_2047 [Microcystis aeruginosa PCC 7806SL]ELS45579.1 hypothetical protein C789_4571 [Microcystis aeruginosa FACHB-905 = DIANCHI905]CCH93475.1 hypothetical protein MICCA_3110007 [Microcystis aeruginosa PCC 9432]